MAYGLHQPAHTPIICPANAKMFEGGSLNLTDGQIGIFDLFQQGEDGLVSLTSLKGYRPDEKRFEIRVGKFNSDLSRSYDNMSGSTIPFSINGIKDVYAKVNTEESKVDIVTLGYNGIDAKTAIQANKGDRILYNMRLKGRQLEFYNFPEGKATFQAEIRIPDCDYTPKACSIECDPCSHPDIAAAVKESIQGLLNQPVAGVAKVSDFVKITPVIRYSVSNPDDNRVEKNINFYCIEMCDLGDQIALAALQAQYPGLLIKKVDRKGSITKYMASSEGQLPAPYKQTLNAIVKGCEECAADYTEVEGGYVYGISIEDGGADASVKIQNIAHAVTGSAKKMPGQISGVGIYSVVTSQKLDADEINTFVEANPTVTISFVVKTLDFCKNPTVNTFNWKACGSCKVSTDDYIITLPDDECGNGRLKELQEAFPDYNVVAYNEVAPAGCQRMYKCTVPTDNMICSECDDIYKDFYRTTPPSSYMGRRWTKLEEPNETTGDLVGIRFEGKKMEVLPDFYEAEELAYAEDSIEVEVWASLPDERRVGIPEYEGYPLHVEYQQRKFNAVGLGGYMWQDQEESTMYFKGSYRHKERLAQNFLGEENRLDAKTRYAIFSLTLEDARYEAGTAAKVPQLRTYDFLVPVGAHEGIQEMVNMLATSAGLNPVSI